MNSFTFGCIAFACSAPLFVRSASHTSATLTDEAGNNVLAAPHTEWNSSLYFRVHLGDREISKRLHRTVGTFAPDSHVTLVSNGFSKSTPTARFVIVTYADDDGSIVISILQGGAAVEGLLVENGVAWHMHTVDGAPLEIVQEGSAANWCGSDTQVEVSAGSQGEARRLRGSGRGLAVQRWTDCWDGEDVAHTVSFGAVITSKLFTSRFDGDLARATEWINSVVAEANLVYTQQLNIVLNIGELVVQETAVGAPSWNSPSCGLSLSQQLDNLQTWEPPSRQGFWHLFDDCFGVSGNAIGLATSLVDKPGTVCVMDRVNLVSGRLYVNTAISWYSANTWKTFAHEVGHTFGAGHSFEDGVGQTGGIMDYGDGKLNGEYQFNTYRKDEICGTLQARLPDCTAVSTGGASPTPSPTSTTAASDEGASETTTETTVTTTVLTDCDDCTDELVSGSGITLTLNDVPYTDCASVLAGASWWCSFFEDQQKLCQKSCGKCSSDCTTTSTSPATTTPALTTTPVTTTLLATTTLAATTTPAATMMPTVTTTMLPTTTLPAPATTSTSASSQGIQSGDTIFLKARSGWSAHMDVQGTAVQARWPDQGSWQALKLEKAGGGSLHSGDMVYLTSHTGALIGVEDGVVAAKYADKGAIQSFRVQKAGSSGVIFPDDIVCLQSHTGVHLDIEDTTVRARWNDCGDWQKMRIERENPDAIWSGNAVYLQAHTGNRIEVNGTAVGARWPEKGLWQRLLIESWGGRVIRSGAKVFLKAHTGNLIDAQAPSEIVKARWPDRGYWQTFTIEKIGGGDVMPGDTIFLRTHLGQHIDVQGDAVQARWSHQGHWQGLVIEKAF